MWNGARIGLVVATGLVLSPFCHGFDPQAQVGTPPTHSDSAPRTVVPKIKVADLTPEDALRSFMLAVLAQDEAAVRAVTLPNPEIGWLLKSPPAPPEVIKDATAQFDRRPMKRLKAGEKITLPKGKQYVVTAAEVGEDRAVVLPAGAPVPTRLHKVTGHWKVAADPFIASRKAADTARKNAELRAAEAARKMIETKNAAATKPASNP